ncbi:MAG: hypothetical protein KDA91_16850 [Planctomycetaceae bacterium]|nr:hypothetical protein [Planctomycetaceae bacterium]
MTLFLQIVAGFFVALILVGALAFWFIRRKIRKFTQNFGGIIEKALEQAMSGSMVPPFRMHLKLHESDDDEDSPFHHIDDVERLSEQFDGLGFERVADFDVTNMPLGIRGWIHAEHRLFAIVYDHPVGGAICDVSRRYTDMASWTASNSKYDGMNMPPGAHAVFLPESSVEELMQRVLEESPVNNIMPADREKFAYVVEAAYARTMNWNIERGGPTEQEIRRMAEINGDEATDEFVDQVQSAWKRAISEFLSEKALQLWKKDQSLTDAQFDRIQHRLTVIHNRIQPEQMMMAVFPDFELADANMDDEDSDAETRRQARIFEKLKALLRREPVPKAFEKLLQVAGQSEAWALQGSIAKPIQCDIWLRPDDDDVDEEDEEFDTSEYDDEISL